MSVDDDLLALNDPGEDDWLTFDDDLTSQEPPPVFVGRRSFLQRLTIDQILSIVAAVVSGLSLLLPWYEVVLVERAYTISGLRPLFLGFVGIMWSITVLVLTPLLSRRFGGFAGLLLIVMGALTVGQVATFATASSVLGWTGRLFASSIDWVVLDSKLGVGAYMQILAGLLVIVAGGIAFVRSLSTEVRRLST